MSHKAAVSNSQKLFSVRAFFFFLSGIDSKWSPLRCQQKEALGGMKGYWQTFAVLLQFVVSRTVGGAHAAAESRRIFKVEQTLKKCATEFHFL